MVRHEEIQLFESRYISGNTPWDTGRADKNLKALIKELAGPGAKILEIGCGTGDNAIFMAGIGMKVTATEIVPIAIEKAETKAAQNSVSVNFLLKDIMEEDIPGKPFDMAFDRGCFHHFGSFKDRKKFARRVKHHLGPAGIWLSLMGNADEIRPGKGPPRLTALQVVEAVEPFFEILMLKSSRFDSNQDIPPRCWILIARTRSASGAR